MGIIDCDICKKFLLKKFPKQKNKIEKLLKGYKEAILLPLRIHKKSSGVLTFSPDPESGEIVAFCELFGYNHNGKKIRPVLGYTTVKTPKGFNIEDKKDTKLYKAIANYVDLLIIDNKKLSYDFNTDYLHKTSTFKPKEFGSVKRNNLTEEVAIVSTFLTMTTINANWDLCFIHTHHSSWQQLVVYNGKKSIQQKIDRVSTKVDLILQAQNKTFMFGEGKESYYELLSDRKIRQAMKEAGKLVDKVLKTKTDKFDAFIYNLHIDPTKEPEYYVEREVGTVEGAIERGHFNNIAFHKNYVFIIVFRNSNNETQYKLVFSPNFDNKIKNKLNKEFNQ